MHFNKHILRSHQIHGCGKTPAVYLISPFFFFLLAHRPLSLFIMALCPDNPFCFLVSFAIKNNSFDQVEFCWGFLGEFSFPDKDSTSSYLSVIFSFLCETLRMKPQVKLAEQEPGRSLVLHDLKVAAPTVHILLMNFFTSEEMLVMPLCVFLNATEHIWTNPLAWKEKEIN